MRKTVPPKDKRLTLRELVSLPTGTEVEYWTNSGFYNDFNPLTLGPDGYPIDREGDKISWSPA